MDCPEDRSRVDFEWKEYGLKSFHKEPSPVVGDKSFSLDSNGETFNIIIHSIKAELYTLKWHN